MQTLQSLIVTNREELVARARSRLLKRSSPARGNLDTLVPYILATLSWRFGTLNVEGAGTVLPAPDPRAYESYLSTDGLTITQIVDAYRDVCNVVMELAAERSAPITSDELCRRVGAARQIKRFENLHDLPVIRPARSFS